MILIDTHSHIFLEEFDHDRDQVISRARENYVAKIFLPNIDSSSIDKIKSLCLSYPDVCYPMAGLHPTSVKENFRDELAIVENQLKMEKFYGIGETGIDLYWDKTFIEEQKESFSIQIELTKKYDLPVIIHVRDSFPEVFQIVDRMNDSSLRGIFHCFSGTIEQAKKIMDYGGFKMGIGGVATFKNSGLDRILPEIGLEHLVLETDSPYLAPVPHRGKRNEVSYLYQIARRVAEIKHISIEEVAEITSRNAIEIFKLSEF
jgi:TatD DNase family protein